MLMRNILRDELRFIPGLPTEMLDELDRSGVLRLDPVDGVNEFEVLRQALARIPHYQDYLNEISLWELLLLTGKPEALDYIFGIGIDLQDGRTNKFGENYLDIAVLSNSRKLVYHCFNHYQIDPARKDRFINLAEKMGYSEMVTYLEYLHTYIFARLNSKVSIFIPLTIADESDIHKPTVAEIERYHTPHVLRSELSPEKNVDFAMIARRITNSLSHGKRMVAESPEELCLLLKEHSLHNSTYYAVQVDVGIHELEPPKCEKQLVPHIIDSGRDKHWILSANVLIQAADIREILRCINKTSQPSIESAINLEHKAEDVKTNNSENLRIKILVFLNDKNFWRQYVSTSKTFFGYSIIPEAGNKLIALCAYGANFRLESLRTVAMNAITTDAGKISSLFQPSRVVNSLYEAIANAKSIYDIETWIDEYQNGRLPEPARNNDWCSLV